MKWRVQKMQRGARCLVALLLMGGIVTLESSVAGAAGDAFGAVAATTSLSLRTAIQQALANNPDLAARAADSRGAEARATALSARRWPSLALSGSYQRNVNDTRLVPATYNGEQGIYGTDFLDGGVTLKLPLYTGGRITSETRGADLLAQSAKGTLARSRAELVFNVRSIFHTILAQQHVTESVEFSVKTMEEHLKRVNELVAARKAARVDALRTEVRRSELQQRLIEARNALAIQKRALANLLGLEATPLPPLHGELALEEPAVCPNPADCLTTALDQRTDYRAARLQSGAEAQAVRAARGSRLPSVSLSGSYGYRQALDPSEQPEGADEAETFGHVGLVVEVPLFEGGELRANVHEAGEKLVASRERLRSLRLRIQREVETALLNLSAARQRVDVTRAAVSQAEESLRIERERYGLGKGTIVDVLDAQSALLQTQTSYFRALADLNVAAAERDLATGKDML